MDGSAGPGAQMLEPKDLIFSKFRVKGRNTDRGGKPPTPYPAGAGGPSTIIARVAVSGGRRPHYQVLQEPGTEEKSVSRPLECASNVLAGGGLAGSCRAFNVEGE